MLQKIQDIFIYQRLDVNGPQKVEVVEFTVFHGVVLNWMWQTSEEKTGILKERKYTITGQPTDMQYRIICEVLAAQPTLPFRFRYITLSPFRWPSSYSNTVVKIKTID
jgi:hypothetical protein